MQITLPLFPNCSLEIQDTPLSVKPYPTTRLQKGFILTDDGHDLGEEGIGFGVPVLKRGLVTVFPGSASLEEVRQGSSREIRARFRLNLIEKLSQAGNGVMENPWLYTAKNVFAASIRRMPAARGLLTSASSGLRRLFNWETTYTKVEFSDEVDVLCRVESGSGRLTVEIDASRLSPEVTEVVVMNEQGARAFDRYRDSAGLALREEEIGCWDEVKAGQARFISTERGIAFHLDQVSGARLFRGRELVDSRLAWAGFGYSFPPSLRGIHYDIRIERP